MNVKNGSICKMGDSCIRVVGDEDCFNCMFNNDTYNPPEGYQFCVFPNIESFMRGEKK